MPDFHALVRARIGPLAVDPARAADIVDELAQHTADEYTERIAAGMSEREALAAALAPLDAHGTIARDLARADRVRISAPTPPAPAGSPAADAIRDLRYAARLLMRTPAFASVAILTLALGIGANTAIFSVVRTVLLRPPPYADAGRLVTIGSSTRDGSPGNVGYLTAVDWRARTHSFAAIALMRSWSPTLVADGEPERVNAVRVSANFFQMLGVTPALGRDFTAGDDTPSGWHVVLLSDGLWRRRFNADPSMVGRAVTMNDQPYTIVGVLPASYEALISERYFRRAELWAPIGYERSQPFACRTCQHLKAFARLHRGVSTDAARADLESAQARLRAEFAAEYPPGTMAVVPLADELTGRLRPVLLVLMGAVGFVLLIACANVANLLLARVAGRARDLALRAALGARRRHLVGQMLAESALLAFAGGAAGVALSAVLVPILVGLAPATTARLGEAHVDGAVLAFSCGLSLATSIVFGLWPALRASRVDVGSLHGDNRKTRRAPASLARRVLIAADVALSVVLLIAAGLMVKSVARLVSVDPGFDPRHVLTLQISMVGSAYASNDAVAARTDEIVARLRALPGVEAAAAAGQIPLGGNDDGWGFHVQGRAPGPQDPEVERYAVTPAYFAAMRIPLHRGRLFTDADRAGSENVLIVGAETARVVWPDADPIGQHVRIGGLDGPWRTVVGIAGDVRHREVASPPTMQMYMPQAQAADSFLTLVLRAGGDLGALAREARRTIRSVAPDVPVYDVAPMAALVARSVGPRRFVAILLEAFSAIALLMTAVGVYGVISYSVAERTREIGIRSALGAAPRDIVRLIVGRGLATVSLGLVAGVAVALATTRLLHGSLYNVSATDPATFTIVAATLFAVALAAHVVPIARALRVDPTVALRQD